MAIKTRAELYKYFEENDIPIEQEFRDLIDSLWAKTETIPIQRIVAGESELVCTNHTVWDFVNLGLNARLELTENTTLTLVGMVEGNHAMLVVKQGIGGNFTITLPPNTKVGDNGLGAVTLSPTAGAITTISFYKSGFGDLCVHVKSYT